MALEGELVVHATWDGGQITGVELASTRPGIVGQVLSGRTASEALMIVPRLFSICAQSQSIAAALACSAALGREPGATVQREQEAAVRNETAREIVRRVLLHWPQLSGVTPHAGIYADLRHALAGSDDALRAVVEQRIVGSQSSWAVFDDSASGERWLEMKETAVAQLIAQFATERPSFAASEVALLPNDSDEVARVLSDALITDAQFERAPLWRGAPAETGALARMRSQPWLAAIIARNGHSAFARFVARIVELVALIRPEAPSGDRVAGALALAPGSGAGWVQTARGLLLHAVETAAGVVRHYRIVAPTEWNFHPHGALIAGLGGVAARSEDEVRRLLRFAIESLDPCVAYRAEVAAV